MKLRTDEKYDLLSLLDLTVGLTPLQCRHSLSTVCSVTMVFYSTSKEQFPLHTICGVKLKLCLGKYFFFYFYVVCYGLTRRVLSFTPYISLRKIGGPTYTFPWSNTRILSQCIMVFNLCATVNTVQSLNASFIVSWIFESMKTVNKLGHRITQYS